MALTAEELQQVENYLSGKGIHADTEMSYPASDDKFLVVGADGTGKYIETDKLVEYLKTHEASPSRATILDLINRDEFKNVYSVGDAIVETYTVGDKVYQYPMIVVDNSRDVVYADGTTGAHRAIMMPLYTPHYSIQWSQYRAFLKCPEGLAKGSYKVTFALTWSKLTTLTWYFTLTHAVPSGGRLNAFHLFADGQSDTSVRTYDNNGKLLYTDATVTSTEIADATDLGTMNYTTRNGNLNCMQEVFYGDNDPNSVMMQWLNSDADEGMWWVAKDGWDCEPSASQSVKGYLAYLDPEHVKMMKTVQVKTWYNTVQHASSDYRTDYLRAFPPSLQEMYIQPYTSGTEGEYLPYFKDLLGTDSPVVKYATYPELIAYDVVSKSAQYVWTRSCRRGYACYQFCCYSSGYVNDHSACYPHRVRPLEVW